MLKNVGRKRKPKEVLIKEKRQRGVLNVRVLIYSFIVTMTLYAIMLFVEGKVLKQEDYTAVYVAQTDIAENTMISADNAGMYFSLEQRRSDWLPVGCVTDMTQLLGMMTAQDIAVNEILTMGKLSDTDRRTEGMEAPVEVSLNANNLSQVVGGVLREGDRINIWSVSENNSNGIAVVSAEKICDYAYVTRVFTTAGVQLRNGTADDNAAMVINIVIPGKREEEFNVALESGTLRIGRCMYELTKTAHGEKGEGN